MEAHGACALLMPGLLFGLVEQSLETPVKGAVSSFDGRACNYQCKLTTLWWRASIHSPGRAYFGDLLDPLAMCCIPNVTNCARKTKPQSDHPAVSGPTSAVAYFQLRMQTEHREACSGQGRSPLPARETPRTARRWSSILAAYGKRKTNNACLEHS